MKICFVSSYPPKHCGVAEFNQDIIRNLIAKETAIKLLGVAINEFDTYINGYPEYVGFQIRRDHLEDYYAAAEFINKSDADLVLFEHEFGLFGGFSGKFAITLLTNLTKSVVCVAHTVPIRADAHKPKAKEHFFVSVAPFVRRFITIIPEAKEKLLSYGIPTEKVTVINHGAPDIASFKKPNLRTKLGLPEKSFIIFSFGLIHRRKGIEYAIRAMSILKAQHYDALLVISGESLRHSENALYIQELEKEIAKNALEKYVILHKQFLPREQLFDYLNACDIGVLPYVYKSYVSSGVLSYFIAAKKPVITTPFAYAAYLLDEKSAYFVPFANSQDIAEGVIKLMTHNNMLNSLKNHLKPIEEKILWRHKIDEYIAVFKEILKNKLSLSDTRQAFHR